MFTKLLVGAAAAFLATGVGVYVAFSGTSDGAQTDAGPSLTLTQSPCCSTPEPSCCVDVGTCCASEGPTCPAEGLAACAGASTIGAGSQTAGKPACCEK